MADPLTIVKQCMRHLGSSVDFLGRHHPEALEEVALASMAAAEKGIRAVVAQGRAQQEQWALLADLKKAREALQDARRERDRSSD